MFDRLTVVKEAFMKGIMKSTAKSVITLSLTIGTLMSGVAVANDTSNGTTSNDTTSSDNDVKSVQTVKVTSAKPDTKSDAKLGATQDAKVTNEETSVIIEDNKIVFAKVGPNEQVISMDVLKGYRHLHQNLRRRTISLSERNLSGRRVSSNSTKTDSDLSK